MIIEITFKKIDGPLILNKVGNCTSKKYFIGCNIRILDYIYVGRVSAINHPVILLLMKDVCFNQFDIIYILFLHMFCTKLLSYRYSQACK